VKDSSTRHLAVFTRADERVKPVSREYAEGQVLPEHWHEAGQLIYASQGIMELHCDQDIWVISPQQALWMPAGRAHSLRARSQVSLRTLFVHAQLDSHALAREPQSLLVTPLLRELILRASPIDHDTPADSHQAHLITLLLDEVRWAQRLELRLQMPRDSRLQKLCSGLLSTPGDKRSLAEWGQQVGASARTLSRLFHTELGSHFLLWRQQVRVYTAIARLSQGEPIVRIATDLGYDSAGAFSKAFRRLLGCSPRDYR
jgi:AraC family transcriptional regulator of arabinose operon